MMIFFTTMMLKLKALPQRVKVAIAVALVAVLALTLAYCSGRGDGKRGSDLAIERANTKALTRDRVASDRASEARVADAKANIEAKKELSDAVEALPDAVPSDRRIALGCQRLRRQGTDTAAIPACRGR